MSKTSDTVIESILKQLPNKPGVYKMLDADAQVIYVGKASSLKKRVSSYFTRSTRDLKTAAMLQHIADIETIVTQSEAEALLLENNLIKELKPKYNILYRDDKSYPYIYVSTEQDFPRLAFHRGAQRLPGRYFGPYPSAGSVRETLQLLQKIFPLRQCEDVFYKNRSRPCLQYQIKRCTAPCVGYIETEQYKEDVESVLLFLEGKNTALNDMLIKKMEAASAQLDFETAAKYRDQISSLRRIQEKQYISQHGGDYDVIAGVVESATGCVQVFSIRGGRNLGNRTYYPKHADKADPQLLLSSFIPQYYLGKAMHSSRYIPPEILISESLDDIPLLEQVLSEQVGRNVQLRAQVRGERKKWIDMAEANARHALKIRLNSQANMLKRFEALQECFQLDELPQHLECFDISHTSGESTVASCVVFDLQGPVKSDYRRFNIKGIQPGDDYAAMEQAIRRRYQKLLDNEGKTPDILFIDGGKGQVGRARQALEELGLENLFVVGVAKGPTRKAGLETLLCEPALSQPGDAIILPADSIALHLIQQIRDESHRFAITGHRQQRQNTRRKSVLEEISGLGPKRRQVLLKQFGGLQAIARAGVDDLATVPGISKQLAQKIYDAFHM